MFHTKTECRLCNSTHLTRYLDFGDMPLANALLDSEDAIEKEEKFPLAVDFCRSCGQSQLNVVVDPEILYSHYVYRSSISQTFADHCDGLAWWLEKSLKPNDLIVDIASNDGTLLEQFQCRRLGVEPATNIASLATVPTINAFWTESLGREIAEAHGKAKVITAFNVFAHVDDVRGFVAGVRHLLDDKGLLIIEVPYMASLLDGLAFDTVYHEHLSYFLLLPLCKFFATCGMRVVRVEKYKIHGGSIRLFVAHDNGSYVVEPSVGDVLETELLTGLYNDETYKVFAGKVQEHCDEFSQTVDALRASGQSVAGFAASAKGCMLLNAAKVKLDQLFDATPEKIGKISPGMHIPIVSSDQLTAINPDHLVLLAWNFEKEIKEKHGDYQGRWIVPVPGVRQV